MSRVVALGERRRLEGLSLAGVSLVAADGPEEVQAAWSRLEPDVGLVILTPAAEDALSDLFEARPDVIWTTMPD
jgi:vacuolar-type H+-ATPase subunit F/Vma7